MSDENGKNETGDQQKDKSKKSAISLSVFLSLPEIRSENRNSVLQSFERHADKAPKLKKEWEAELKKFRNRSVG